MGNHSSIKWRNMPGSAEETTRHLIRLLECPVCLEPMRAPIEQCSNGHNICALCRRMVANCPSCRSRFKGIRNRLAEDFSVYLLAVQCPYSICGCPETIFPNELKTHQNVCCFRPYECKICSFPVAFANVQHHVAKEHPRQMLEQPLSLEVDVDPASKQRQCECCALVAAYGRLFWFWRHLTASSLFVGMQRCGGAGDRPDDCVEAFTYRVVVSDKHGKRELCFTGPVHADGERWSALEGQAKCFNISRRFLLNLLDSGMVRLKINIY